MQENTNKAIIVNSIINYAKMGINTILALFTTRFALQALGINDFGLFSVLGSIISFIGIFNTIMLSTSNRFLTVAIGKGDSSEVNKQFNVNLVIFIAIAIFMLLIAFPIGDWYVHSCINYDGPIANAMMVFSFSLVASVISTLATPYNGLLMAKERFIVFSLVEVFTHIVRFIIALLLVSHFNHKLLIYTVTMSAMTAIPALVYWIYCKWNFREYVEWNLVKDKKMYKDVFSFSGWVAYGAIACIARNQGAALLVNAFFNTVMNTALGIANSLNSYVTLFANNLTQPMQPQIIKNYASGSIERTDTLLVMSTKFSFLLMLIVGMPFFVGGDFLMKLWLGNVPDYAVAFTQLLIIDNLLLSFNSGISNVLFASGKIALYQVVINTLRLLSIIAAYFVLKSGAAPYSLFLTYIVFSVLCVLATQYCLQKSIHYNVRRLVQESYIPSLAVLILCLPLMLLPNFCGQGLNIVIALFYMTVIDYFVGLSKKERQYISEKISVIIEKAKV